jgi:CRISPR/Cas system-associated exonuclease Cas4 (RecB family)
MSGQIPQWSYSRLTTYEGCPKKAYYSCVKKIREPGNKYMERGKEVHKNCEDYIRGHIEELPTAQLKDFQEGFDLLRKMYLEGSVICEGDWAFDKDWQSTGWFDSETWGRAKVDAFVHDASVPTQARVIDFKTGKYEGNQESHREQCELYGAVVLARYPEVETITTEMWYLDHNKIERYIYNRDSIKARKEKINERAIIMTTAEDFPANPSSFRCKWCYFGKERICPDRYD